MARTKVALAGATGNLGAPVLRTLLATGYDVRVLSRKDGNSSRLAGYTDLDIVEVDFGSIESLTAALQGTEVVVSCVATLAMGAQNPLIDAAVAAGVKRFIPAEFGMDSQNSLCMALPVCVFKVDTRKYLAEKVKSNPEFSYTAIANGFFLDWCLEMSYIIDPTKHTATLYNGGDVLFSATTLSDVARAVIGVIENQNQTANRLIYVHSTATTQNQLIKYMKDKDGKEWHTTGMTTEELRQNGLRELAKGEEANVMAAMDALCLCAMFSPEYGCDFTKHLDNDIVGIKAMDEAALRALVESFM